MGLPCISGFPDLLTTVSHGELALVDADSGIVAIHPDGKQKSIFPKKVNDKEHGYMVARSHALSPAITRDGVTIAVLANVGCSEDTEKAMLNGAEGVGLYRLEQVYLGHTVPPDTDELVNEMQQTLEAARDCPVNVRLLDVGSDKPLPFMGFLAESNPSLGRRGIRFLREYPELLKTQLRAVLELATDFDIRV
jgi:phosphoenolpyruvate-protein kinase (PTS system EI component)